MRPCIKVTNPETKAYGYAKDLFLLDPTIRDLTGCGILPTARTCLDLEVVEMGDARDLMIFARQALPAASGRMAQGSDGKESAGRKPRRSYLR